MTIARRREEAAVTSKHRRPALLDARALLDLIKHNAFVSIMVVFSLALLAKELTTVITNQHISTSDYSLYVAGVQRFLVDPTKLYLESSKTLLSGYLYPPPSVVLFLPFGQLSLTTGYYLFATLAAVFFLSSLALWFAHCEHHGVHMSPAEKFAIVAICASLGPTYHNFLLGQVNLTVLAACVGFFVLLDRHRLRLAGLVLAVGIWLKLYPLLLCVVALRDRRSFLAVAWTGVFLVLIAVALLPVVPLEVYRIYVEEFLPSMSGYIVLDPMNHSFAALITRLLYEQTGSAWQPYRLFAWIKWLNLLLLGGSALLLMALEKANLLGNRICTNACLLAAIPMFSPLGWGHTYALALPLLILCMHLFGKARGIGWLIVATVVAFALPTTYGFDHHQPIPSGIASLFYGRYFLAAALAGVLVTLYCDRLTAKKGD
jgi:hypothetical protein